MSLGSRGTMWRAIRAAITVAAAALACGCAEEVPRAGSGAPPDPAPEPPLQRIAFGSCAFQWAEQPIFRAVVAAGHPGLSRSASRYSRTASAGRPRAARVCP